MPGASAPSLPQAITLEALEASFTEALGGAPDAAARS